MAQGGVWNYSAKCPCEKSKSIAGKLFLCRKSHGILSKSDFFAVTGPKNRTEFGQLGSESEDDLFLRDKYERFVCKRSIDVGLW